MNINWFGQGCVRLKGREATVVIDPLGEGFGLKVPKLKADVVCISHDHADHNNVAAVAGDPYIIKEPGEYHIKNTFVGGVPGFHDNEQGGARGLVTMFTLTLDGINIAHLADIGQNTLTDYQVETIGSVDVLFIPVGGIYTVDGKQAAAIVGQLEPKLVVPIHFDLPNLIIEGKSGVLNPAAPFLKEFGAKAEPQVDYKVTLGGLSTDQVNILLLAPSV